MQQILATGAPFTAVLASNDESALGAMQALAEIGIRVPQDVAVIGFDDRPESAVQKPALTQRGRVVVRDGLPGGGAGPSSESGRAAAC